MPEGRHGAATPRASVPKPSPSRIEKPRAMSWGWLWTVVAILLSVASFFGKECALRNDCASPKRPRIEAVSPTPEPV